MADPISVSGPVSGTDKSITFETGLLAPQSQGAVVATLGGTKILVTANAEKAPREGIDFFPLTVDIEEKRYAAGIIPGSVFRKEGRPSDEAILTCRLIDRPLRPSFAEGYRNETQIIGTVLGVDMENPHDVLAINAASAALMISGIPFEGPIGAVRLAYSTEGTWVPHPTYEEGDESTFEIVVAGRETADASDIAVMMVEAGGTEDAWKFYEQGAPKVTEEVIAEGLEAAKTWIRESIALQREFVAAAGVREPIPYTPGVDYTDDVYARVAELGRDKLAQANTIVDKTERNAANDAIRDEIKAALAEELEGREREVSAAIKSLTKTVIRERVVNEGVRIDGRGPADIRAISCQVGLLPTAHGSALFQRGETQVLNVLTLGMPRMAMDITYKDSLNPTVKKRYMHHYTMPPFSNGETGRVGGTKRREVGHGLLAERALLPVVPSEEEFPYALRLVSEVLSSNGSTSMASVCSSSMSLMDGGVPIKAAVAGIAMGLIYEDGKYTTLTDILGAEDAFGDMDFKVAGTAEFVTALQLDTKIDGIPADVLAAALSQAKDARMHILDKMSEAIAEPRDEVGPTAPKIISFEIPIDKIGEVIGPKGKVINAIQQETGADINVDDDGMVGTVSISSSDMGVVAEAERQIKLILNPPTAEVGATYTGRVVNITKFGAFVNILPGRDGLLHISKMGQGKRIDKVEDVVDLGDTIEVKVDDVDPQGKVSLSLAGDAPAPKEGGSSRAASDDDAGSGDDDGDREFVSFEDEFESELTSELGDLGPATSGGGSGSGSGGGSSRGGRGRGRGRGGRR
ncbi:polyribonucleotide nucleotidyltransferase [Actinomarinicola tropica]|uniref:Polyribonucleotide nucleotidyltransferase n=1 Tax=Actinomarinicola tropica TaxID=2789776 RepID=A0A5Q2RGN8_9ACTN|nr:polyribonucleotide nucleotidyltransferase [Actinomarinicola tropica]QGG94893.1 polyribonucleotide nucleotidyltransferase [Actinomarinicola tropica]